MELKVNWDHKRCKHALERMWLRGISHSEVKKAIREGQKHIQQQTGLIESLYSFYSVVYDEKVYAREKIRKVYPITVKIW